MGAPQPRRDPPSASSLALEPLLPFPPILLLLLRAHGGSGPGQNNVAGPRLCAAPVSQPNVGQVGNPGQNNPISVLTRSFLSRPSKVAGTELPAPGLGGTTGRWRRQGRQVGRPRWGQGEDRRPGLSPHLILNGVWVKVWCEGVWIWWVSDPQPS